MEQLRPNSCLYGLSQSPESSGAARRNWESWETISLMVWHPSVQKMRAESQSPQERKRGLGGNSSEHTQATLASCPLLWSCQNLSRVSTVLILSLLPTVTITLDRRRRGKRRELESIKQVQPGAFKGSQDRHHLPPASGGQGSAGARGDGRRSQHQQREESGDLRPKGADMGS